MKSSPEAVPGIGTFDAAQMFALWQQGIQQALAATQGSDGTHPSAADKRFSSAAWQSAPQFQLLADSYLAASRLVLESVAHSSADGEEKMRTRFFLKQMLDALSPANFLATNPDAIKAAIDSNGATLQAGMANLQHDLSRGRISMTDESAFRIGENIAVSPGAVVFENDIFQLIQYSPTTEQVYLRPLLMVPPCINKFYILDLRPGNSYVEYAVQQGFTVFMVSWRNIGAEQGHLTWDDYVGNGVIKAIDVVRLITNVEKINALGFCVGGTMLACALAILRRLGHDPMESMALLAAFIDFTDVGEVRAYVDEAFITRREGEVGQGGIVDGADLAFAFSSLRANELVWSYVINNYLKGEKPPAFDLLYWNSDNTNLAGPWYCWYIRNTYVENNLIKPDKMSNCGVPLDLRFVDVPAYVFAAREDHIVPWRSAYLSTRCFRGEIEFVLGASGHVAGVVNPASKNKRSFWQGGAIMTGPNEWLHGAVETPGSWWPHWSAWLTGFSGRRIKPRTRLGSAMFEPIEAAPGRYVKEKV